MRFALCDLYNMDHISSEAFRLTQNRRGLNDPDDFISTVVSDSRTEEQEQGLLLILYPHIRYSTTHLSGLYGNFCKIFPFNPERLVIFALNNPESFPKVVKFIYL